MSISTEANAKSFFACAGVTESTVIDVSAEGGPRLVREGPVSREELERVLGRPVS